MQNETFHSFGNWELRKMLGTGGFGQVILWRNRINQTEIATKSLNRNDQLGSDETQKLKERWLQEIEFMRNLDADFIVRALALDDSAFVDYLNECHAWRPLPVLIMEYCNSGDLRAHLQKIENLNGLVEFEIREVLRSLRNAIDYMHNKCHIKHRDLKPDNIVIHKMPSGEKIYKLTDFGFARYINDSTMLASVVGTRNYFAPEVVDTSGYTRTVDYWSVGVMAFELLCGMLPFIPHRSLFHKINEIKGKPADCIAITEDFSTPKLFHKHSTIFDENRVSSIFRHDIEKWLRLCLDVDYRTRATTVAGLTEVPDIKGGRVLRFYSELDVALNTRILTVFCLSTYHLYCYAVNEETVMHDFLGRIVSDISIPLERLYFILPVGHPLKCLKNIRRPFDLFVKEFCDTSDSSNPPAMLYIADTENSFQAPVPQISAVITNCFLESTNNDAIDEAPIWLTQKFAIDINFLLTQEQRQLTAYLDGLKQYAINVEDAVFKFGEHLKNLLKKAYVTLGMSIQFASALESVLKACDGQNNLFSNCQQKAQTLCTEINEIVNNLVPKLQKRYDSNLRRIKEQASSGLYDELTKKDIYGIKHFQRHLQSSHLNHKFDDLIKYTNACNKCRSFVHDILEKRAEFLEDKSVIIARSEISALLKEFTLLQKATETANETVTQRKKSIEELTRHFYTALLHHQRHVQTNANQVPNEKSSTQQPQPPLPMVGSDINGLCDSFHHWMEISTKDLIEETQESMRLMSMEIDQHLDDIPTTVNQK